MGVRFRVRSSSSSSEDAISYEFEQSRIVLGRGGVDVKLPHSTVSHRHAVVEAHGGGYAISDEGSTNGTAVNGVRLAPLRPKPLRDGDVVRIPAAGTFELEISVGVAVASATTQERTEALARRLVREVLRPEAIECAPPRLVVRDGPLAGHVFDLSAPAGRWVVGRGSACDLVIDDAEISREQLELESTPDGIVARPLEGKNPVLVDDKPLVQALRLHHGSTLVLGATLVLFEDAAEAAIRAVEKAPDDPALAVEAPRKDETTHKEAALRKDEPSGKTRKEIQPSREHDPSSKKKQPGAELVIYGLAFLVLALSVAGLVYLLR